MTSPEELRDELARPALERIAADRRMANRRVAAVLREMGVHLFDPGTDVSQIVQRLGLPHNVHEAFTLQVGTPPRRYFLDRRLETAQRLLAGTSLRVLEIASLVGYTRHGVFGRAFRRWCGMAPGEYRGRWGQAGVRPWVVASPQKVRRVVLGSADVEAAETLVRHVLEVYPELRARLTSPGGERVACRSTSIG